MGVRWMNFGLHCGRFFGVEGDVRSRSRDELYTIEDGESNGVIIEMVSGRGWVELMMEVQGSWVGL